MKFAVLDDSKLFLQALQAEWDDIKAGYPEWIGVFEPPEQPFEQYLSKLADYDHLLLDISLLHSNRQTSLQKFLLNTRFWMMTGRANEQEIAKWQQWAAECPQVQSQWFEKPLSLERVVFPLWQATSFPQPMACVLEPCPPPPSQTDLNEFPFSCRWFDAQQIPVIKNQYWRPAAAANPYTFTDEDIKKLGQGESIILDIWGEYPDQSKGFGKVRYSTRAWKGGYLQFAVSAPLETGVAISAEDNPFEKVMQAVQEVFDLMLGSGSFTRARYYEVVDVPGSSGVLRLLQAIPPLENGKTLPIEHPMGATLVRRKKEYENEFNSQIDRKRKWYWIRYPNEEYSDESDLVYWHQQVNTGKASWLTLPVFRKKQEYGKEKYETAALLVFDRVGKHQSDDGGLDEAISEDSFPATLKSKLSGSVEHLRDQIKSAETDYRLQQREAVAKWRKEFIKTEMKEQSNSASRSSSSSTSNFVTLLEAKILESAKKLTGANSALLALRPPAANYLEVRAASHELMSGLRLSLKRKHFIAVQCVKNKAPVHRCDYQTLNERDKIQRQDWLDALSHLPQGQSDKKRRVSDRLKRLMSWEKKKLGSVIALPVKYDNQPPLGVLVLRHEEPYFFTAEKVKQAQRLTEEAQPFLHRARSRTARNAWDSMIFHEIRSGLSHIRAQADWVLEPSSSRSPTEAAKAILARTESITDLSNELLAMLGYNDQRKEERKYDAQDPLALLDTLWAEFQTLPEAKGKELVVSGETPTHPLHDPNNVFPHVLRVLLDNALRYGKAGEIKGDSRRGSSSYWHLTLSNPRQFSDNLLNQQFSGLDSREDLAQTSLRAHIGLASCRQLLDALGGRITLKNDPQANRAVVTLDWPYDLSSSGVSK